MKYLSPNRLLMRKCLTTWKWDQHQNRRTNDRDISNFLFYIFVLSCIVIECNKLQSSPVSFRSNSPSVSLHFRKTKKSTKKRKTQTKRQSTFKCTIRLCGEEFPTKDDLIAHKINTHKRIQCTNCPDLKLVLDLNTHLKNMHGIIQTTICEHCGQEFHSNATFLSHVKGVHEVHEPLQCDICKDWFKSRDSIRSHMTYVHIQGPQTCQICGRVSRNRKSLLKHQKIHIESRKDRFKCIVCGKGEWLLFVVAKVSSETFIFALCSF